LNEFETNRSSDICEYENEKVKIITAIIIFFIYLSIKL